MPNLIDPDVFVLPPQEERAGLDEQAFVQIKSWCKGRRGYTPKPAEPELERAVEAMLRRWGLTAGTPLWDEAKDMALRLHNARLKEGVSRAFWHVLRYNVKRLL